MVWFGDAYSNGDHGVREIYDFSSLDLLRDMKNGTHKGVCVCVSVCRHLLLISKNKVCSIMVKKQLILYHRERHCHFKGYILYRRERQGHYVHGGTVYTLKNGSVVTAVQYIHYMCVCVVSVCQLAQCVWSTGQLTVSYLQSNGLWPLKPKVKTKLYRTVTWDLYFLQLSLCDVNRKWS